MIFERSFKEAAKTIIGRQLVVGTEVAIVLEAQGFSRESNNTSLYRSLLSLQPGDVFIPRRRNAVLTLIACMDGKQTGGCVLIRGIELNGKEIIQGPGKVSHALHLRVPKDPGRILECDDGSLELHMERIGPPRPPPKKPRLQTSIGQAGITKCMPMIAKRYLQRRQAQLSFQAYLNQLIADCVSEAELRRRINTSS